MLAAFVESGSNGSLSSAQVLFNDVSYIVDGRLSTQTDLDFYTFYAESGSTISARARAIFDAAPPSPQYQLDPIIAIYAPGQSKPVTVDDDGGGTTAVPWTAVSTTTVNITGFWTVAVTRYDDFEINGSSAPESETPGKNTGRYRLTIDGGAQLAIDPSSVVAQYDTAGNGDREFGSYLPNVALQNKFTVGFDFDLPSSLAIKYQFSTNAEQTATRSGQDHVFTQNMGLVDSLRPSFDVRLVHLPSGRRVADYQGTVEFQSNLSFAFDLDYGSGLVPHDTVRLIGSQVSEPAWAAETRLESSIQFFDQYKSEPLSLVVTSKTGSKFSTRLSAQSDGRWTTAGFPTSALGDVIKGGKDYDVQLAGTLRSPQLFTTPHELLVISLPKWMTDLGVAAKTYQNGMYEIRLKSNAFSEQVDLTAVDPLELLKGKRTSFETKLELLVKAPASIADNVGNPYVEVNTASLEVTLFGDVLATYSMPSNLQVESKLKKLDLEFDGSLIVSNRDPISLGVLGAPFNRTFSLPAPIVTAVGTATAGVASLQGSLQVGSTPGPVNANFSFQLDTLGDKLVWNRAGTYVELYASMAASAQVSAGIDVLSIAGLPPIASLTVSGGINASLAAQIRFDAGGPLTSPGIELNRDQSGATLGLYYDIDVVGNVLFNTIEVGRFKYTSGSLAPIQLLGHKELTVDVSTHTGTGISTSGPPPAAPFAEKTRAFALPATSALATFAPAGSPPVGPGAEPQGTLRLSGSIPSAVDGIEVGFSVHADQATLTPDRHRLDFVMVGRSHEVVLDSIDLAGLSYTSQLNAALLTSGPTTLTLAPSAAALDPTQLYQLELRFFSDAGAGGETVHVQLLNYEITLPPPQLSLATASGTAEDGVLEFGTETVSAATETISLTNTGGIAVIVSQIDLTGTGFEWVKTIATPLLLIPGQSIPISLRVSDPLQSGEATVAVYGASTALTLATLELAYDPLHAVDVSAPAVAAIELHSTQWDVARTSVSPLLGPLAQVNLNQVKLVFSEDVVVLQSDLLLEGGSSGPLQSADFQYDPATHSATWTFAEPLGADQFTLQLQSGITDLALNPLPPQPAVTFSIMPGNADGDGVVGFADFVRVSNAFGMTDATVSDGDFNADGIVDFADFVVLSNQFGVDSADFVEPNIAPRFAHLPKQVVAAGATAMIQLQASDGNLRDVLSYALKSGPTGAVVDPTSGLLTFPTPNGIGGTYSFVVTVQDDGSVPAADEMLVVLEVRPVNYAPQIVKPVLPEVRQEASLFLPIEVNDANLPLDKLTFELVSGPTGVVLDATTGILTWKPGVDITPGIHEIEVRVTDSLMPPLSDSATISLRVLPKNLRPTMASVSSIAVDEGTVVSFQATASDPNLNDSLTFELGEDAPAGATIDPATGWFSWIPDESQGPQLHVITLTVRDDAVESLTDSVDVLILVRELNASPQIQDPGTLQTSVGQDFSFVITATDVDLPANQLNFALESGPTGLTLGEETGLLQWTPGTADLGTHSVTVRVSDDGVPPLESRLTFTIQVGEERQSPVIYAFLALGSTGTSAPTADFSGSIDEAGSVVSFIAGLNNMPIEQWVDVLSYLDVEKEFVLPAAVLEQLNNGPLAEGLYTLHLSAVDGQGLTGNLDFSFEIDRTPPTMTLDLRAEDDSGTLGDLETSFSLVTLVGQTEANARVEITTGDSRVVFADAAGRFLFPDVELNLGTNTVEFEIFDAAGNESFESFSVRRVLDGNSLGPDAFGYAASVQPSQFIDISATGTPVLVGEDNSEWLLTGADLDGFTFRFYGVEHDEVFIGTNGLLAFEAGTSTVPWGDYWDSFDPAIIAAFWTDLVVSGGDDSAVYYQVTGPTGSKELVVQWHQVSVYGSPETLTFQAVLSQLDSSITFNYFDVDYGTEFASVREIVGIKPPGRQPGPTRTLILARDSSPNELVGNGLSTRIELVTPDELAPLIAAQVLGRYGYPLELSPTNDLTIVGTVLDTSSIIEFSGGFDATLPDAFEDLLADRQSDGSFELSLARLGLINGAPLQDGVHTFYFRAQDSEGNIAQHEVAFHLDTAAPSMTLELLAEDDSGTLGDLETSFGLVTLLGQTEPHAQVELYFSNDYRVAYANGSGLFLLPDVELALGNNTFQFTLRDDAGNESIESFSARRILDGSSLGPDALGYLASVRPPQFIDISATGTAVLVGEDDDEWLLTNTELEGFTFRFYGVEYHEVFVGSNGLLAFEAGVGSSPLGDSWNDFEQGIIAAFWTDLIVSGGDDSAVYYQVTGPSGSKELVVQWHQVSVYGSPETLTFQAILSQVDSSITFNYFDFNYGTEFNAVDETVGIKPPGRDPAPVLGLKLARNSAPNELVGNGLSTRIELVTPDVQGPFVVTQVLDSYGYPIELYPTNELTIVGTILDTAPIIEFSGALDVTFPDGFKDLLVDRQSNGSFELSLARLELIYGASLPDGVHTFYIRAQDSAGNATQHEVTFLLDRVAPTGTIELAQEFDSPPGGDRETTFSTVDLVGLTEPFTSVRIPSLSIYAYAESDGRFRFRSVPLQLGVNELEIELEDEAGNIGTIQLTLTRILAG